MPARLSDQGPPNRHARGPQCPDRRGPETRDWRVGRASHEVTMLLICGDREQLFQAWVNSTGERCKAVERLVDAAGMRQRSVFQQRLAQVEIAVGLSESALLAYKKHVAAHGCSN